MSNTSTLVGREESHGTDAVVDADRRADLIALFDSASAVVLPNQCHQSTIVHGDDAVEILRVWATGRALVMRMERYEARGHRWSALHVTFGSKVIIAIGDYEQEPG